MSESARRPTPPRYRPATAASFRVLLVARRAAVGLAQRDLDRLAGLTIGRVGQLERGWRPPNADDVVRLGAALGFSAAETSAALGQIVKERTERLFGGDLATLGMDPAGHRLTVTTPAGAVLLSFTLGAADDIAVAPEIEHCVAAALARLRPPM